MSYGHAHRQLRERWRARVASENTVCMKCGLLIGYGEPWDLAHDPLDPTRYLGVMHRACNRDTRLEKRLRGIVKGGWRWSNPAW
jgi:hypothetical protein